MNKKTIVVLVVAVVAVLGVVYLQIVKPYLDNRTVEQTVTMNIRNDALDYMFSYPSGEAGYTLIEPPIPPETEDGLRQVYIMMQTQEYIAFQSTDAADTTPPTVSIFVLDLPEDETDATRVERTIAWAVAHPQYTMYRDRLGEPEEIEVDGVRAIRYNVTGTYQQQVYLVPYQGRMYVFAGQYTAEEDPIRGMYNELIGSVLFN